MASGSAIQNSLNAGELAPSLLGRTDLAKYQHGCSTARNFWASYKGGLSSRAGLAYVGTCKQQYPIPPRDIPFQFSLTQGFVLEFGDQYMRVKSNGAYVVESTKSSSVNSSGLFTVTSHGYSVGDWIYDVGNTGFNGLTWIVKTTPSSDTFTVTDLFGNTISSATASSGGTVARIYTVVAPYAAVDLPYLKYTQSADVMTLTLVNQETNTEYPPYSLIRDGSNTNWVFTAETFSANISAPTGLTATAQSSGIVTTWYSYVVTAVDRDTGEESVASSAANIQNVDISLTLGSNTLTWNQVDNAKSYNVYASTPSYSINVPSSSLFGFIGIALGPGFVDTNIIPDFTKVPPKHSDPFVRGAITDVIITNQGSGNYSQDTISYSVTTSTGTGFSGTPVVQNGYLVGFVINNPGKGYLDTDTITFSDSGGGKATGTYTLTANPADANSSYLGGIKVEFKSAPYGGTDPGVIYSEIENTKELTVQRMANTLNASDILSLSVAEYTANGATLTITYKTSGSTGNTYTLATNTAPATISGANLTGGGTIGTGATASLSVGPQSGTYPSVSAYFQQRRVYANSNNEPDTYWMSQPGLYNNMDSSIPVTSSDAITGTPWAQQINGIQFLVPMPGGLVVLTGRGAWQVNGGSQAAITPSNQTAVAQAYNGCSGIVPPIPINYDILYVQSKGSVWRDLSYNFFTNIYTGTDLTVLSSHLFTDYGMVQAAWAEEPYKLLWGLRNDGVLLSLTYLKEQDVYAWTRHDTNGLFVGVCSVTELPVDAVYVITQRFVQGAWRYYSERMDNRIWSNVEDSYCVDSGLSYPQTFPDATLNVSESTYNSIVTCTTSSSVFTSDNVGDIIRVGGGKVEITAYNSGNSLTGKVIQKITQTIPNDPLNKVEPAKSGEWSISTPTTTVSGLNHLEGLEITCLADGSVVPNQIVVNGTITLPWPASKIVVGLPYICQAQTMYLDTPAPGGTIQNKRKNISSIGVRVEASRGLQVGADQPDSSAQQNFATIPWTNMNEIKERTNQVFAGSAVPLYTGDYYKAITSGWGVKGQVAIQQTYPLPANILAIVSYWDLGEDGL